MTGSCRTAYIALGSNLGDRQRNISEALSRVQSSEVDVVKSSSLIETDAVGGPAGSPPFLNAAAQLLTTLSARQLLNRLLEVERSMGRVRRDKWEPREIDLDLLLFDDQVLDEPGLVIPHPLMHTRSFVLQPLAEIAPDAVHPVLRRPVAHLLRDL